MLTAALWCVVLSLIAALCAAAGPEPPNLLKNPTFAAAGGQSSPADWTPWGPGWDAAECSLRATPDGLLAEAPGRPYAVGGVFQVVPGITGGQAYAVRLNARLRGVLFPYQAVTVRVEWLARKASLHPGGMLVSGPRLNGEQATFADVLVAPEGADSARVTLEVRWPRGGSVLFRRASLTASRPPEPRKVRLGTVFLRPQNSSPARNLDLWCEQIAQAGKLNLDIVCLGEAILQVGSGAQAQELAEPIPGPSTRRLGEAARAAHCWVIAGLTELRDGLLFNTAVLLNREGELAGVYRKVHLPREEWKKGIAPGAEYPVFTTDFGTIGIFICYDWFFPEATGILAREGAEVIFAPTWGNTLPDHDGIADGESVFRVRARDNGVYLVPSVYDGNSMVIDPLGRILASSAGKSGVFWAEVDLSVREPLEWVGHWRSIGPRDRMPDTYEELIRTDTRPNYP